MTEPLKSCGCGCGEPAPLAQRSNQRKGHIKGQPLEFLSGHNKRGTSNLQRYTVEDRGYVSPCWIWSGPSSRKGYGSCQVDRVKKNAHRAVFEKMVGPVADNLHLDHLCRVKMCVNPDHMDPVTPIVNEQRKRNAIASRMINATEEYA